MDDFDEFLIMLITLATMCLGIFGALHYCNNDISQNKCYEIYATDNVILKECEKYFK